jgi:hypothetical protein
MLPLLPLLLSVFLIFLSGALRLRGWTDAGHGEEEWWKKKKEEVGGVTTRGGRSE